MEMKGYNGNETYQLLLKRKEAASVADEWTERTYRATCAYAEPRHADT